jgi:hypothetical protein
VTRKQESAHEWQTVGPAKKRKQTQSQQYPDQPNQAHINTNNRFEAVNQQQADGNNDQTQPHTQPTPKPPPITIYGVLNYKKNYRKPNHNYRRRNIPMQSTPKR